MSSKKEAPALPEPMKQPKKPKRGRGQPSGHRAVEKAQAVLAIWTERVKTAEVMREMGVTYITLQQWQERAMEGMLQALESRVNLTDGGALSPRLKALLEKRQLASGKEKLQERLERLQEVAPVELVPETP
jgi:transposase-like protein